MQDKSLNNLSIKRKLLSEIKRTGFLIPYTKGNRRLLLLPALLIPLIAGLQVSIPQILRLAIDEGVIKKDYNELTLYSFAFLGVVLLSYLARTTQAIASIIFVQRMIVKIRAHLVGHVLKLKAKYHDKNMSGALVTRATSDFDNLTESLNFGVLNTLVDLAVLSGNIAGMYLLNWKLAIIASLALPLVIYAINKFSHALKKFNVVTRKKIATLNAYTQESLYGNATIKLLRAEEQAFKKHNQLNFDYRNSQMKVVAFDALLFSVIEGIASITIGLVLWYSLSDHFPDNALTAGVMVAFVQLVSQLFDPLKQLGSTMAMLQGVFTSIDRIFGILNINQFIEGNETKTPTGTITLENVKYRYDDTEKNILNDISFSVEKGKSLAIVGSTGSGKSTIIKLLSKLYDNYSGSIKVGGQELSGFTAESIRSNIAIVPQDIVIFDGTISFNISLGIPGVTEAEVEKAAKLVGADKFINQLPDGYNHKILERGANLSHGQRQLLAFARALCMNPDYVILDEATSSVDPASEREIQQALLKILQNKTVIVIAHRLSTIKECDDIIVLESGKIIENGRHEELVQLRGRYFELVNEFSGEFGLATT